jgi:hypothetical protein
MPTVISAIHSPTPTNFVGNIFGVLLVQQKQKKKTPINSWPSRQAHIRRVFGFPPKISICNVITITAKG